MTEERESISDPEFSSSLEHPSSPGSLSTEAEQAGDENWNIDELDRLYRQALEAVEAVSQDLNAATESISATIDDSSDDQPTDEPAHELAEVPISRRFDRPSPTAVATRSEDDAKESITTAEVIESLLFVGGDPLSARKICGVLKSDFDPELVEHAIESLNDRYTTQKRPYEIRLIEGGYRMALRPEFEAVRNRAFGLGPKDVRLANDLLEILSVVAYKQPISRQDVESLSKKNAGSQLRQLLRRELIALERTDASDADVAYRTTPRFLQLFGLTKLTDLPQAVEIEFK